MFQVNFLTVQEYDIKGQGKLASFVQKSAVGDGRSCSSTALLVRNNKENGKKRELEIALIDSKFEWHCDVDERFF